VRAPETASPEVKPSRLKRFILRLAIISAMLAIVAALAGYLFADSLRNQQGPHTTAILIDIERGDGRFAIKHKLQQAGVISHPLHLDIVVFLEPDGFRPRAGEYKIPAGASLSQIIALLNSGKTYQRRITIIEGWRSYDVMLALNEAEGLSSVILRPPPEGSVFPDTYYYTKGMDRREILATMQEKMEITLAQIWAERRENLPYKSPRDLLIMASIIEKETGRAGERTLVSGVFVNRLRKKMRLQSDPTVAYGLVRDAALPTQLTKKDLNNPHSWNTYRMRGLPIGPIANPGADALQAAANPEVTKYLYFVADGKGGHNFAKTLDAHNRNVRTYRKLKSPD
jgi:UPF0755 protein